MTRPIFAAFALLLLMPDSVARTAPQGSSVSRFLAEQFGLKESDVAAIERRRPVVRTLDTQDGREVATVGVIRLACPPDFYVDQLRQIAAFKRHEAVLQIGTFGAPARAEDAASLTLEPDDVAGLRKCRPGDCAVQLSREALDRFTHGVRWNGVDAPGDANHVMREVLADLANAYRTVGDAALMTYVDSARPLAVRDEFRAMVKARPAVLARFPAAYERVTQHRAALAAGGDDILYWSKEKLGPKVIVTLTHLAIVPVERQTPVVYAIASKQIYASHYFDASLGLTLLLRDTDHGASGDTYLVYLNRSRLDVLGGFWGGLKRTIVRSKARSATATSLVQARDAVESRYRRAFRITGVTSRVTRKRDPA